MSNYNGLKRYLILCCAVIMQMCLGATYSWSVFVKPLRECTGLLQGPVQLPFTLFYFIFPATMVITGAFLKRFGPRRSAVFGGILCGAGWLFASLGDFHFTFTVVGIGLIAGLGVGLAYIVPITVCIQWFPRNQGLVTGIAVAGFGGGAALVSLIGGVLLEGYGAAPFTVFAFFGCVFLVLVSGAGMFMQNAPDAPVAETIALKFSDLVRHKVFIVLYGAMLVGLAVGFSVNANLKEFFSGQNVTAGITAVSLFAVANALGRILWGLVHDRTGSSRAILANLASHLAVLLAAFWLLRSVPGFLAFAIFTGFNYGGILVLYVSSVARTWQVSQVARVYGLLFTANIPAALFPIMAGLSYDAAGHFRYALAGLGLLVIMAFIWVWKNSRVLDQHREG